MFLIIDGHPVHRSRKVTRWLEEQTDQMERFFLPGYSPHLNPDELLNQDVKTNAQGRLRPNGLQPGLRFSQHDACRLRLGVGQEREVVGELEDLGVNLIIELIVGYNHLKFWY